MSTNTTLQLVEDRGQILALLRLAQWAAHASTAVSHVCHLRENVPSFRAAFDPLTPGLTFPEVRNNGELVADVLAVAIELLEARTTCAEGGAA